MSITAVTDGKRHLVTAARAASGAMTLYVDAVREASTNGPAGTREAPRTITIGAAESGGARFAGELDDVRIYRRDLAPGGVTMVGGENLAATATVTGAGTTTIGGGPKGSQSGAAGSSGGGHHCGFGVGAGLVLALLGLAGRGAADAARAGRGGEPAIPGLMDAAMLPGSSRMHRQPGSAGAHGPWPHPIPSSIHARTAHGSGPSA